MNLRLPFGPQVGCQANAKKTVEPLGTGGHPRQRKPNRLQNEFDPGVCVGPLALKWVVRRMQRKTVEPLSARKETQTKKTK